MNKTTLKDDQVNMFKVIVEKSSINIVTCGACGDVVFHKVAANNIVCPHCLFKSEPCDFPDFYC